MTLERAQGALWPAVLVPRRGHLPPTAPMPWQPERVLHVALRAPGQRQAALAKALGRLIVGDLYKTCYDEVDWLEVERQHGTRAVAAAVVQAATRLRPTIVVMQVQRAGVLSAADVEAVRRASDLGVVIVNWDGDQHCGPRDDARRWFVELGRVCDMSLVPNTDDPAVYADLGVVHPGYTAIGYDDTVFRPQETSDPFGIVFVGNYYPHLPIYQSRLRMVEAMAAAFGDEFCVYGNGWPEASLRCATGPFAPPPRAAALYAGAEATVVMSAYNTSTRCTSNRLFNALGSGALALVERFPDMEGFGLRSGINCLIWEGLDQLGALAEHARSMAAEERAAIRGAAAEMAPLLHSWDRRIEEWYAMIRAVRTARRR